MFPAMSAVSDWQDYQTAFRGAAEAAGFSATLLADLEAGPLVAWERPGNGPRVYLSAGIHGDEPAGPLALLELLREGVFTSPVQWSICPMLNPSGLAASSRRTARSSSTRRAQRAQPARCAVTTASCSDPRLRSA